VRAGFIRATGLFAERSSAIQSWRDKMMRVKDSMIRAALAAALLASLPVAAEQAREGVSSEEIGRAWQSSPDLGKPRGLMLDHKPRGPEGIVDDPRPKISLLIHFDRDSARIKPESHAQLAEVAKAMRGPAANAVIAVAGHTDSDGSDEYNLVLAQRRAEAVRGFLAGEHGIPDRRLRVESYGEGRPLVRNELNDADKAQNRRVEFIRVGRVE
jgi:outer membrane protein OmpA-like peptidoglycan-associated protein